LISRSDLSAIFRRLADEIEKDDDPSALVEPSAPESPIKPKPVIDLGTIKGVQQALNALTSNLPHIDEDGVYGPVTRYVTKLFQISTGIPVTGEADEATVSTIHKLLFGR
jgi:peptidoglycan hydrolase-like protein with peptidoglycan-binding domain